MHSSDSTYGQLVHFSMMAARAIVAATYHLQDNAKLHLQSDERDKHATYLYSILTASLRNRQGSVMSAGILMPFTATTQPSSNTLR
jgi:hypothetical protein